MCRNSIKWIVVFDKLCIHILIRRTKNRTLVKSLLLFFMQSQTAVFYFTVENFNFQQMSCKVSESLTCKGDTKTKALMIWQIRMTQNIFFVVLLHYSWFPIVIQNIRLSLKILPCFQVHLIFIIQIFNRCLRKQILKKLLFKDLISRLILSPISLCTLSFFSACHIYNFDHH